ncbi:N-6 DNA methylase [Longimicrobium terrae]|uniref:site-specific DNA-methyltransferase (adenine-specific) n=1 Tax=Longimicrobium terrae TaxID=1639882 RepID=A0A841H1T4_9BACT|nr:N-6 DNA methylase [Longimicrobium terrae]MBB4637644.1 type I restriction enzyme M protein [Longimicrobium terrae]MBB6072041.1 type I restriction enzyme M protein [Longimicrobium terrae]NNC29875.1 N-6 DNA methylase [Longimicrobium terrae]
MLDLETKRRIDTARDILVGKVPDPKSQVEQITIALIYKFMDDMDAEAEELGGQRSFFAEGFSRYGWAKLMRSGLGGHEVLNLYAEAIGKMPENPGIPLLFRDIFKNAFLPYRDPETLRAFLKVIDGFEYDHSERLGDAFEYLLSILGSQGDAGQFRTPRHIIDFVVSIVDPKKHETVLDPACGTAGFLISAYKHILQANSTQSAVQTSKAGHDATASLHSSRIPPARGDLLTPDERGRLAASFKGYDISPDMVRLSLVNLYLHGFTDPHIYEYDTLTSEDRWNEHADVIFANPPFMSPKGGIKPHTRFSIRSKRSEVLFLDYIIEHLSPTGKAGVIVPEGIHFVAQSGHETLRRTLIEKGFLLADITLPHGVFKPYASVKTHILVIDRAIARRSNSVLFVEIENDGYSQSDTREPLPLQSQLPVAKDVVLSFKEAVRTGSTWECADTSIRSYVVPKPQLLGTSTAHLLGRWHDLPNRVIHRSDVPLFTIGELCRIEDGRSPNMATTPGEFVLVVPAEERKSSQHWDFEGKAVCVPLVSSAGHGKADIKRLHYQEGRFALATTMCALFPKDETVLRPRFLYVFLSAMCTDLLVPLMCGATNVTMDSRQLSEVLIPVPEASVQDEVVESYLVETEVAAIDRVANALRQSSSRKEVIQFAERLLQDTMKLRRDAQNRANVSAFLPS